MTDIHRRTTPDALRIYNHLKIRWKNGERPVKASYTDLAESCLESSHAKRTTLKRRAIAAVKKLENLGLIKKATTAKCFSIQFVPMDIA